MNLDIIRVGSTQYDVCDAASRSMMTDEFSEGTSYSAGALCIYNNTLYTFKASKSAGAWDASKVSATTIDNELTKLNSNMFFRLAGYSSGNLLNIIKTLLTSGKNAGFFSVGAVDGLPPGESGGVISYILASGTNLVYLDYYISGKRYFGYFHRQTSGSISWNQYLT